MTARTTVVTALLGLLVASGGTAAAGLRAQATGAGDVATGTWAAVATTRTAAPWGTGPASFTYDKKGRAKPAYLRLVNTGTLPLDAAQHRVRTVPSVPAVLELCTGTWDERNDSCSGQVVPAGTTAPRLPGDVLAARVRLLEPVGGPTTVAVDVLVPPPGAG